MNQTTEKLVSIFTQNELSALMTAMGGYINTKNKQKRPTGVETVLFNKIVDALLLSNELNAIFLPEEFEDNPLLPLFYENKKLFAFPLEYSFLIIVLSNYKLL